jgi:hypothetical protein
MTGQTRDVWLSQASAVGGLPRFSIAPVAMLKRTSTLMTPPVAGSPALIWYVPGGLVIRRRRSP